MYIHDVLPLNYNEQGIHPNDPSISKHTKFFSKNDSLLEARKKWYDFILQDYNYFWDVYSNKINYRTLTDPEIVKLQDIYDIVYFINPDGIRTLLNTPDTHAIVNYVYQRFIKVKNWVPTRHYSYYVWLIYGWRELPHHFLCYNSGYYNDEMILSRWVPKFLSYDDFKNYDHYIIEQQYQNNPSQTILPRLLSSKKQKSMMMPRNHFELQYDYYDSVRNSTSLISSDPRALFHNQEQKFKVEKYIKVLELTFEQLYESEFEKEEHNLFPSKNIPLDWIIWYDSYNQKYRDALYSYGYKIHTANYLKDPKCKNHKGLIKFCRASNQDLLEPEPTYLHKVFSKYTRYDNKFARSSSVPCNNLMVRKNFEKDLYYIGPGEKYTYWNVFPEEDKQSRFCYYLSTIGNSNLEYENMYYEIDYDLGEDLRYNTNEGIKNKNSDQNMASDSENMTEENFIQDSRTKVRKCSTEEYFDVRADVHENSSTGPLSCVSGTANPTYDTVFTAETQCHDMVRTKMTKTNSYFCNLFPVEYVHDLNIFPLLHVCSICVIRKIFISKECSESSVTP